MTKKELRRLADVFEWCAAEIRYKEIEVEMWKGMFEELLLKVENQRKIEAERDRFIRKCFELEKQILEIQTKGKDHE